MTKVSVFGKQPTETKELKKIEFVKFFDGDKIEESSIKPTDFDNVVLIAKQYSCESKLDLIYAFDKPTSGNIYLGHWNDGVV